MQHAVFETKSPIKPQENTSSSQMYFEYTRTHMCVFVCTHYVCLLGEERQTKTVAAELSWGDLSGSRKYGLDMIMIGVM